MIYATAIVGDENENLWLLKLLLSFLGMIDITKAHWQGNSGKSRVSMEIGQPVRTHRLQNSMCVLVLACAWFIKFSRLPHEANVNVVQLLKTMKACMLTSEQPVWHIQSILPDSSAWNLSATLEMAALILSRHWFQPTKSGAKTDTNLY